jgi:hypothetical protein
MKLHDFTSEYEATLCQSPSTGKHWAAVFKGGSKVPELETDEYEDWEDAMSTAVHFINEKGQEELDEARGEDGDYEPEDDDEAKWERLQREQ